ncbi:peptidase M48 Ste24p [Pseudodesulfovibrio mercurii]|uniref:Peptidase M48 Ste24p n=1 Tax=Pseudodesulfovibrio mercurii TaxID=641491 RepID=F0JES3_9BACT|nr:M48 family metallopeptidase [Pseudodesulfovibrio mercurii]EGB13558.1 peptidase M48 Ste24p [Pseudodesulfovibrio mercurii]
MIRLPVVFLLLSLLLSLFAGCAPVTARPDVDPELAAREASIQKRMAVESHMRKFWRLSEVSLPVLEHGTVLCGDRVTYYLGMDTNSIDNVPEEWRQAYKDALGLDERIKVTRVFAHTPAADAGFQPGDVVLMINGRKVETGDKAYVKFAGQLQEQLDTGETVSFWIERDGAPMALSAIPAERCDYAVLMSDDTVVNAYADGDSVVVTKGMMDYIESDDELALVVGHEMGHNVMGHITKKTGNRIIGAVLDGLLAGVTGVYTNNFANAAGMMYSQEFEQEADYMGVYFMERAGFDSTGAPNFWRRMGADNPYAIGHATTHPTSAYRYVFLEKCSKEVKEKEKEGTELLPNMAELKTASK